VDQAFSNLMKRFGTTAEQAAAILFLASDEASYITGVTLPWQAATSAERRRSDRFRPGLRNGGTRDERQPDGVGSGANNPRKQSSHEQW
jgi:hypothetical protein